jgi:nitroreductase
MANAFASFPLEPSPADPTIPTRPPRDVAGDRVPEAAVDERLLSRWSRRAISPEPLPFDLVRSLFEAARWAPSAGNLQPWLFVYAADPLLRKRAHPLLSEQNRRWAARAPLLIFVFARRNHPETGRPLRCAAFDAGAAWLSLALQAQQLGLVTRAMGGIDHEQVYKVLGVPEAEFESQVAIAVGFPGDPAALPEDLALKDYPSPRKRQHEFVFNGRYTEPSG